MPKTPLTEVMHQLMHAYKQLLHEGIAKFEVNLPVTHIRILKTVNHYNQNQKECTVHAIAHVLNRDKAQITRALNDLIADQLILKKPNPLDGRSQLLNLTKTGDKTLAKIQMADEYAVTKLTENLDTNSLALFFKISRKMIENADKP